MTKFNIGDIVKPTYPTLYDKECGGGYVLIVDVGLKRSITRQDYMEYSMIKLYTGCTIGMNCGVVDTDYELVV